MNSVNSTDREIVFLIYQDKQRGKELARALEIKMRELGIIDNYEVIIQSYSNKMTASLGIKENLPIFTLIQSSLWGDNEAGFELLEYYNRTYSDHLPFYSIIHGTGLDQKRRARSLKLNEVDPYHLGTCSADLKVDELLIEKIIGVLMQQEEYVEFEHLESQTAIDVDELIEGITSKLYPLKEAVVRFRSGDGKCFAGVEPFLLNMEYELKKVREYYNYLFNIEIQRRKFGKIDDVMRRTSKEVAIDEVFSDISQFLTHTQSPLVQMAIWMKSINPSQTHYFQIYQFLEGKIGDNRIHGYCRVFLENFKRFEKNIELVRDYVSQKV